MLRLDHGPPSPYAAAMPRFDGWYNAMTGHGSVAFDKTTHTTFCYDPITEYQAEELWRGNDLAARVIEAWPDEIVRAGWKLQIDADAEAPDAPTEALTKYGDPVVVPGQALAKREPAKFNGDWNEYIRHSRADAQRSLMRRYDRQRRYDASTSKAKDDAEAVMSHWETIGLTKSLWRAMAYKRAYGGGAILIGANDGATDLTKELNIERVRSFDWLTVLDTRECRAQYYYDDPTKPKYGEVSHYLVSPCSSGAPMPGQQTNRRTVLVHESRMIVFDGARVSRQMQTINGWGDSVLVRFLPVLSQFGISWQSAAILMADYAVSVFKIKGLAAAMAQNKDDVIKTRARAAALSMSTARAMLIDTEEEWGREQSPLTQMPEMLDRFAGRLAAAGRMPQTKLFGRSPAGQNATGESDIRLWYDEVDAERRGELGPVFERIVPITMRALGIAEPENWSMEFCPLWQPTEKEVAETRYIVAQTDEKYINLAVYSPEECAVSRFGGDTFSMDTIIDFDSRAEGTPVAEAPAKTQQQIETEEAEAAKFKAELDVKAAGKQPPPGKE